MTEVLAWSYSRLNVFEQCPKRFNLQYVLKVFPKFDDSAYHLQRGKLMHAALERYLKTGDLRVLDPETNPALKYPKEPGLPPTSVLKCPLEFLLPVLDSFRRSYCLSVEGEKAFDAQLNEVSWFDSGNRNRGKVWVRVILDVLALSSVVGDVLIIADWKSGKIYDTKDQLRLFAAAGMLLFPHVEKVVTGYVWLDHPNEPPLLGVYTRERDFDNIWQEFGDRAELIQLCLESGNWEAKPAPFNCKYCPATLVQCEHKLGYE